MATKVFLKWFGTNGENGLTTGREYEFVEWHVVNDSGTTLYTSGLEPHWQRIERQTFEANGFQWFAHEPGDAIPCDGDSVIHVICKWEAEKGEGHDVTDKAKHFWFSQRGSHDDIIGWRFADSAKPEVPQNITCGPKIVGVDFAEDPSERNDLIATVDDGHLTPGQKAYINAKEEKVAERLRSEAAKEELKRADHSKSIQDLANANGAVKFEHDHRLGWMQ